MSKVYMIANVRIEDADEYRKYEKGFFPILKRHGGRFLAYDDNVQHFEGSTPLEGRTVMFEFDSEQAARDWYSDPEYQAISEFRRTGTRLNFLAMVTAPPPRS
ncbi:MAG: DUF1330 domain-containing protein [Gammaproteobacteria bacterium AqS3]|nr:DUF1330 domain-containing protein [Gammaproteobacteria bacterium AqS3]